MQTIVAMQRAISMSVRTHTLASSTLRMVADVSLSNVELGIAAHLREPPTCHLKGTGNWNTRELLLAGAAVAITAVASSEALCEAFENAKERDGGGDMVAQRRTSYLCDDSTDSGDMSLYFDAEFELKKLLGCGTFGMVMQCVHKQTGRVAAVKMIQDTEENKEEAEREKLALERLERAGGHKNIVGYEGSYYHNSFHYIVLEFVRGISLHSLMEKRHTLDATWSLQLVSQLASALQFMHEADIIHRDLKPENIMALENNNCPNEIITLKIIDFGSVGRKSQPESIDKPLTTTLSGTRCYWSPEVLQCQDTTPAMDMWALGCILYILISGRHPFDLTGCSSEDEILQRVETEPVSFSAPVWHTVSNEVQELICGLLEKDPRHRLSAGQVLEHPAIVEATRVAGAIKFGSS